MPILNAPIKTPFYVDAKGQVYVESIRVWAEWFRKASELLNLVEDEDTSNAFIREPISPEPPAVETEARDYGQEIAEISARLAIPEGRIESVRPEVPDLTAGLGTWKTLGLNDAHIVRDIISLKADVAELHALISMSEGPLPDASESQRGAITREYQRLRGTKAINGGLHVGGASDPGDNNALVDGTLEVVGLTKTTGGVHVGGSSDPGADNLQVDGTLEVTGLTKTTGGVHVGGSSDPGADNLAVDGDVTISGLTASLPVFTDANKKLVSTSIANTLTALDVYTKGEVDALLGDKSDTGHTHTAAAGAPPADHTHAVA